MMNRISMSLLIAALLAAPSAFARPVNPAEADTPILQVSSDLGNAHCVLSGEDSRCLAAR
jgi:hypothetical protein